MRGKLGDRVRQLVAHHVVSRGKAFAIRHLVAIPVGVLEWAVLCIRAIFHQRNECHALAVEAIAPEVLVVVIVGHARIVVGKVDIVAAAWALPLDANIIGRRAVVILVAVSVDLVVIVADHALFRVGDLVEVQCQRAGLRVDQRQLADGLTGCAHAGGKLGAPH